MAANIWLFGDDQAERLPAIRSLYSASRTRPQLRRFLREASELVRLEASSLAEPHERLRIGHFDNLLELAEQVEAAKHPEATACAILITAAQVGELLCLAERDPSLLAGNNAVYALGFCIGLLAASVAAGACDTSHLVRLGVEAVATSFRLGLELTRRARLVEHSSRAWSAVLIGSKVDIERDLKPFNRSISPLRQAYVGVVASSWVTIFGPPSTLAALMVFPEFGRYPRSLHRGTTAVHAPHLPDINVENIVGRSPLFGSTRVCRTLFPLGSRNTSEQATTVRSLLEHAVVDIASSTLWPEEAVRALNAHLKVPEVVLTQVGPTGYMSMVQTVLQGRRIATQGVTSMQELALDTTASEDGSLVAIVGMSGRFPGCNDDMEEFWDLLVAGRTTHEEVPESRFALKDFYDPSQTTKNAVLNRFGCFLQSPGLFDPHFFRISPREALQMDPLHRMFLMTAYEALQQAGYNVERSDPVHTPRISTFFGQTTDDWRTINDQQGIDTHYGPCSNRAFAAGRIAHFFGWNGGAYSVDTACSSSATCIHLACNSLIDGESDAAIVGGGSLCVAPEPFSGLGKGGFLSLSTQDGSCKSFQERADGYCRGEAVGVVVLKRLRDAVTENDNVLAVIRGSARNSNAGAASIMYPGEMAQEALFRGILQRCNVEPSDVGFIEMHGTGTQAGDTVEMSSIRKVFGRNRTSENPLYVGAVKASIGHSEAAAGVVSLIKAVLMLRHDGAIPPQPGYPFAPNSSFGDLAAAHIRIADGRSFLQAWPPKTGSRRKVLVNSFDAAGGNTSLLVEEPPKPRHRLPLARAHHLIAISGGTAPALAANKVRLRKFLTVNPSISLADLAYTTTARRLHEVHRHAFVASSVTELCELLDEEPVKHSSADPSSLIFVFQGEGSLSTGMGAVLYETSPYFRSVLESFQSASNSQGQQADFVDIVRGRKDVSHASAPERQMAIVALEVALAQYLQSLGLNPTLVLGHSLGEYAALCVAGVISVADTFFLLYQRATRLEQHCNADSHAMLAIAQPARHVGHFLARGAYSGCEIACASAPSSTVVSGNRNDLRDFERRMHDQDIQATVLPVPYGFHSAQMDPALDSFEEAAAGARYAKPRIPVASSVTGKIVTEEGVFGSVYLRQHMRQPVRFFHAVRACEAAGYIVNGSNLVEVGPGPTCASLVVQSLQHTVVNFWGCLHRGEDVWKSINIILANAYADNFKVNWREFYKYDLQSVRLVDLPKYAFDVKDYWRSYHAGVAPPTVDNAVVSPLAKTRGLRDPLHTGANYVQEIDVERSTAVFLFDIADRILSLAIQGHLVDGTPICPVPVFADMAITAALYLLHMTGSTVKASDLEFIDMIMTNPLVMHQSSNRSVRVVVGVQDQGHNVTVAFSSEDKAGYCALGKCDICVHASSQGLHNEWAKMQKLVKSQVKALQRDAEAAVAHRMNTTLVYKLFSSLVDYSSDYMAIKEAFISTTFKEGTAIIDLSGTRGCDHLTLNPFAIDALVHLAGFLLNADLAKAADDIYIANHIDRLHVLQDLSVMTGHVCTSFASVRQQTSKTQAVCDVYAYDDQGLIAACTIRFQKLQRALFQSLVAKLSNDSVATTVDSMPATRPRGIADAVVQKSVDKNVHSLDPSEGEPLVSDVQRCGVSGLLLDSMARHTGIRSSEIESSSRLLDLGIDSLMSIAILQDVASKTSVTLPAGYFANRETVAQALEGLDSLSKGIKSSKKYEHGVESYPVSRETITEELPQVLVETATKHRLNLDSAVPRAVLIQGNPHSQDRPLFLITDGSGSVSGYIHLPALPCGRRILALESPFVERPQDYRFSVQEMAQFFMLTIRKEQPHGPYMIGGWSAGGIYAYETCYQLAQQGETISGLVIIDMAIPRPIQRQCEVTLALVEETGIFAGVERLSNSSPGPAALQKMHVVSTVRALAQYRPTAFPKRKQPLRTYLIWATRGLNDSLSLGEYDDVACDSAQMCSAFEDDASSGMTAPAFAMWLKGLLCARRTHMGTNGWERLVGNNIHVATVDGDHFSIVSLPSVKQLGEIVSDAVVSDAELSLPPIRVRLA